MYDTDTKSQMREILVHLSGLHTTIVTNVFEIVASVVMYKYGTAFSFPCEEIGGIYACICNSIRGKTEETHLLRI